MSREQWTAVDEYTGGLLAPHDEALDAALRDSDAAGLPAIQVPSPQGKLLYLLARTIGARTALEFGTLGGYSTIWLGRALPDGGRLVSLEFEPRHAEVARANLTRAGLDGVAEVRVGRAVDTLARLVDEGAEPFDLVFIDADKPSYPDYLEWSLKLTRPGSLIIADNVVRGVAVADPDNHDALVVAIRRFLEQLATDPRLTGTVLQTVGVKGYDGLAIAYVM
jgi:predicted O-methyltransferase YrrM